MPTDRLYTHSGSNTTDGNYPRVDGPRARVMRLCAMRKGSWPAHPEMGTDWDALDRFDDQIAVLAQRVLEAGQKPLLDEGAIRDVVATIVRVTDHGLEFTLHWTDATTGDSMAHSSKAAWTR